MKVTRTQVINLTEINFQLLNKARDLQAFNFSYNSALGHLIVYLKFVFSGNAIVSLFESVISYRQHISARKPLACFSANRHNKPYILGQKCY
jgi:hypothetical protein